jgi:hypothetical protein
MMEAGRPAPEVYRQSMQKLPLAQWRARRFAVLSLVLATTAVTAAISWLVEDPHDAIDGALIIGSIGLVAVPYVMWRAGQRVRRHYNAFELSIGADHVRIAAKGSGRVTFRKDEIMSLSEGASGLVVHTSQPGVVVQVPLTVEGYPDVRSRLAGARPIARRPDAILWALGVVSAGFLFAKLALLVHWAAVMLGLAFVLCQLTLAAFGAVEVQSNPLLSPSTKIWAIAVIVVAAFLPAAAWLR